LPLRWSSLLSSVKRRKSGLKQSPPALHFPSETCFEDDRDFSRFRQIVDRCKQRCACLVYHRALMPNHYHLLIRLTFPMLRPFAAGIQQCYAGVRLPTTSGWPADYAAFEGSAFRLKLPLHSA
jgi:hypothetical protein